jgi:hypothetical protein
MVFKSILKKRGNISSNTNDGAEDHSRRDGRHSEDTAVIMMRSTSTSNDDSQQLATCWRGRTCITSTTDRILSYHPPPTPMNAKVPSIEAVPICVNDLTSARNPGGERAARALRKLFAISQHAVCAAENRRDATTWLRMMSGNLVPGLLSFLGRCEKGSNEQNLTLLILNTLSIPHESKRLVALEHHGAKILSQMLCQDPKCQLVAIVLVNLTYVDPELRSALVSPDNDIDIIESLSFALRVATLTRDEYEHQQRLVEIDQEDHLTARELLVNLLAEDQCRPSIAKGLSLPSPSNQAFPETARWCLAALKNLTRLSEDTTAACSLIMSRIVPHILRFLVVESDNSAGVPVGSHNSVRDEFIQNLSRGSSVTHESSSSESVGQGAAMTTDPEEGILDCNCFNCPSTWDSGSAHDAALFIILNLSAVPMAREYLREIDAVKHLSLIADCEPRWKSMRHPFVDEELLEFQRLKARMALGFLIRSESHFGQPRTRVGGLKNALFVGDSELLLIATIPEVARLVELLAVILHRRCKEGAGGYSADTFSVKLVLMALRCLLSSYDNQVKFATAQGPRLNALLLKVLALHSLQSSAFIDKESAECACFSLFLLSNYGFQEVPFLPKFFAAADVKSSIIAKVLTAYIDKGTASPAGKHAASQILLRLKYLTFKGSAAELAARSGCSTIASDFYFEPCLVEACNEVFVRNLKTGARPDENIFARPILRRRMLRRGSRKKPQINWDDNEAVDSFPCALQAVQDLSFNSSKVRHLDAIDEMLIANNVVHCANGEKTESYNYMWSWQDTAGEIQRNLEQQNSSDSFLSFAGQGPGHTAMQSLNVIDALCGV